MYTTATVTDSRCNGTTVERVSLVWGIVFVVCDHSYRTGNKITNIRDRPSYTPGDIYMCQGMSVLLLLT